MDIIKMRLRITFYLVRFGSIFLKQIILYFIILYLKKIMPSLNSLTFHLNYSIYHWSKLLLYFQMIKYSLPPLQTKFGGGIAIATVSPSVCPSQCSFPMLNKK